MPTVSVVITCFNYERYVGQCVRSVLEQTARPLEVIVVDDGSTDGSAAVLAEFGERIQLVRQDNRGHVAALHRGFAESRGDLIVFLDADDLLHRDALDTVARAWRPGCAKVQFELEVIDAQGAGTGRRVCNFVEPYGPQEVRREFAIFGTYVWPVLSGNAYSRWFVERLFPLRVIEAPDGVLNTLAPLYGEVRVITRALGCYRLHASNYSYHGVRAESIGRRFARQVEIRSNEIRLLREHAAATRSELPRGNILDRELPFVNYRLMLKRLGEDYEGAAADSMPRLWAAALATLAKRPLPVRLKLAHAAWVTALLCSPRWLSRRLILLRFQRMPVRQLLRRTLDSMPWGPQTQ
jgi:glycosyltransferase involved in cell wall biosynthesis